MEKRYIRKIAKFKRRLLSKSEKMYYDILILRKIKKILTKLEYKTVFIYLSLPFEVDTKRIIDFLISKGKRVCIPKVINSHDMVAVEYDNKTKLRKNKFGIDEPVDKDLNVIIPASIDICIIPLIAFDKELNRIGFGKGFYDRFLQNVKDSCFKIGLAYQSQMFQKIKSEDHDIKLDMIITERKIYS